MRFLLLAVCCLLVTTPQDPELPRPDPPPLRLTLQIDGQEHALLDGQQVTLTIGGEERQVKVSVAPTRRFDAAGVQFEFPRDIPVGFETGEALDTWTLDGGDVTLMLFVQKVGRAALAGQILQNLAAAIASDAPPPSATTIVLGGRSHSALQTDLRTAGVQMHHLAADLDVAGTAVTIVVQDSVDGDGAPSADAREMLDLLARTWTVRGTK